MAGDIVDDRAVLWTYSPRLAPVSVEVYALDGDPAPPVAIREVAPSEGGYFHADVGGLVRGAWYGYVFVAAVGGGAMVILRRGRLFTVSTASGGLRAISMVDACIAWRRDTDRPELALAEALSEFDATAHGRPSDT